METTYYIYHIPTYVWKDGSIGKIGVSDNLKTRMRINMRRSQQSFDFWEVLEQHTDIMIVSQREIELQNKFGYKVDKVPYWKSRQMGKTGVGGKNGGKHTSPNGGKIGGKIPSYHLRKLNLEDAQMIRRLYSTGEYYQYELAKIYGVSITPIRKILINETYTQP